MSEENQIPEDEAVYVISVASQLSGLHPQTLRQYDIHSFPTRRSSDLDRKSVV